ncbi:MAG: potassium transporter TrkG [Bacteroidales bacterium]|nr:potassium transporter TrkG [Bacteroidales bacterium]
MKSSGNDILLLLKKLRQSVKNSYIKILSFGFHSELPQRNLVYGYAIYILIGLMLLCLPFSQKQAVSILDNLFIITSAVSTTGLVSVDIGSTYSVLGQIIILFFIQIGGIGYMTFGSYLLYNMTHHFNRIKEKTLNTTFSVPMSLDISEIVKNVVRFTFFIEAAGALLLFIIFKILHIDNALWSAIFHSVSSFCTAGFGLYSDSLMKFDTNIWVNIVIAALSYAGAMGFIFITDIWNKIRRPSYHITFTSKNIIVITTSITIIGSIVLFFQLDKTLYSNVGDRAMISIFQTMSAMTTVGFNTIDLGQATLICQFVLIMAMFIGASPSGTGGGVKSTTISAVFAFLSSKLSDKRDITICHKRLPTFRVDSALTTFISYQIILFFSVCLLLLTESLPLDSLIFEATSALGTVGLSTGITSSLSSMGKIIIILLMYIGRLGVFVFGSFMLTRMKNTSKDISLQDDLAV